MPPAMVRPPIPLPRTARPGGYPPAPTSPDVWGSIASGLGNNSNALIQLGSGLLSQNTFQKGLAAAGQGWAAGNQQDQQQAALTEAKARKNQTLEYLKSKRPDIYAQYQAGLPIEEAAKLAFTPIKLGPGDVLLDPLTKKPLAEAPNPAAGMAGQKEAFDRNDAMWKEYMAAEPTKTYQAIKGSYERLRSAATQNTGAGDVSLIYGYMKMLDPGSVVREGEFATAEQTAGLPATIVNIYNKLLNGERLTEQQRADFIKGADGIYTEASQNLAGLNQQFTTRAGQWGVDPSSIVQTPETYSPITFGTPAAAAPATKVINGTTYTQGADGEWYY